MGIGALLAQSLKKNPLKWIAAIETLLALTACIAVPLLYLLFAKGGPAQGLVLVLVVLMGTGLGMEIPLLNLLERNNRWLNDILFFDYLGGFIGGLLFPLWLLPSLGFFRLAAALACANAVLAVAFAWKARSWRIAALVTALICALSLVFADSLRLWMEATLFGIRGGA